MIHGDAGPDAPSSDAPSMDAGTEDVTLFDGSSDRASSDASATDAGPSDANIADMLAARRRSCAFHAGARVADTLGFTATDRMHLPIDHVIVLIQENRSFDHYLGSMNRPGVDGIPSTYTNPNGSGGTARPSHAPTTCISPDVPHTWDAMHAQWNSGRMDGFYTSAAGTGSGQRALYYYTQADLPFYYWLNSTFAMCDRFFSSVIGPTWPNRDFLYAGTSAGVRNTFERTISSRTIYDELNDAHITWGIYIDGEPRQDSLSNWMARYGTHIHGSALLNSQAMAGTLPQVVFFDGKASGQEEHPTADISRAEHWVHDRYLAIVNGPQWPTTAFFFTYDEAGGFFDHVPPPAACVPDTSTTNAAFNRMGFRLPSVLVSPYARPGYVSHVVHETTSITRFIELMFDLPALTARDANSDAMLDLFDFSTPAMLHPPVPPNAGASRCP
jgi:phospholipase C